MQRTAQELFPGLPWAVQEIQISRLEMESCFCVPVPWKRGERSLYHQPRYQWSPSTTIRKILLFFFLYKQPVLKPMYNKIDHDRTRRLGCTRRCDCSMAMHVAPSICFTYWHCENMGVGDFLHLFLYSSYLKDPYSPYLSGISIFSTCKEMHMFLEVFFLKLSLVAWVFKVF